MSKSNIQRSICLSFVLFINLIDDDSAQAEGAQLGGKIWAKMATDLMEDKPNPAFDVYRGFVTGNYTFAENWSSSIIVEAATTKAVLTSIHAGENISLFQAMIQGKKLLTDSDTLRVGLAPGQYLVPLYKKLGTRYLSDASSGSLLLSASRSDEDYE